MNNYSPVKREDIDLKKTYCLWVEENDYECIDPEDLKYYVETGELCHEGYEISTKGKEERVFEEPIYVNPMPKPTFVINDNDMKCLKFNNIMQAPDKAHNYSYMLLFKTKCGRHLIGNKRGDQWRYKTDIEGKMSDLPDKYEVIGWIGLD